MAGRFQQETLRRQLEGADVKLALTHHPPDWLVAEESPRFGRRLRRDFHLLLHGHEHQEWVEEGNNAATVVTAGACYEGSERATGYSLVRLDLEEGRGEVWLCRFAPDGGGWLARPVHGKTDDRGVWLLELHWASTLTNTAATSTPPALEEPGSSNSAAVEPSPELAGYLRRLRAAHRDLPVAGFETRVRIPIRLDEVYVPLRARIVRRALEHDGAELGAGRHVEAETDGREVRLEEALTLAREHDLPGLAVLGDAGSAKTTLLKHLVRAATDPGVRAETLGLPADTVPVFIALRRLGRSAEGLEPAVAEALAGVDPTLDAPAFVRRLLARDWSSTASGAGWRSISSFKRGRS